MAAAVHPARRAINALSTPATGAMLRSPSLRPDGVKITCDDLGVGGLGSSDRNATPTIVRLATEGNAVRPVEWSTLCH